MKTVRHNFHKKISFKTKFLCSMLDEHFGNLYKKVCYL